MTSEFLDAAAINSFDVDDFLAKRPFPWRMIDGLLTESGFATLRNDFPPIELFDWHAGRRGSHYVKPQDRYFLAYGRDGETDAGTAGPDDLPDSWVAFIDELESSAPYQALINQVIDVPIQRVRYTWHMGVAGSEVCPHVDQDYKMATNIFYFNTADDWDPAWGGNPVILDQKKPDVEFPDFGDFAASEPIDNLGNRSFLFCNTTDAWHGVHPLTCPDGRYRRLFNVVFENLDRRFDLHHRVEQTQKTGVRRKLASLLGR